MYNYIIFFTLSMIMAATAAVYIHTTTHVRSTYASLIVYSFVLLTMSVMSVPDAKSEVTTAVVEAVIPTTPSVTSPHQRLIKEIDELVRYRLNRRLPQEAIKALVVATDEANIDPKLVLAIIEVESGFNPHAESTSSKGLMQINAGVWKLQEHVLFDSVLNIKHGVKIFKEYLKTQGSIKNGLTAYNHGPGAVAEGNFDYRYYNKVMKIYNRLKVV